MNFDDKPPVAVSQYRRFQTTIPGIDCLYVAMLAVLRQQLPKGAHILISGAGGGQEIDALGGSPHAFRLTGVDPSRNMLDVARNYIPEDAHQRVQLIEGRVEDVAPGEHFDAATSILVMHFLPDDGSKVRYLQEIRSRLRPGAPYIHVDASIFDDTEQRSLGPVMTAHGISLGFPEDIVSLPEDFAREKRSLESSCIVVPDRNRAILEESGFEIVSMFFRTMWFTGWWARAA